MSQPSPIAVTNGSIPSSDEAPSTKPELELTKLQSLPSEQQDLYLLTFTSTLTAHVQALSSEECTAQQSYLKKELFQILDLSAPSPSRVVRNNLGRCFAHIFGKGDRRLLFETANDLINTLSSGKSKTEAELKIKHAAAYCLGECFASAGDSAIGLHPLACTTLLKQLKVGQSNAGYRAAVFQALGKVVKMIGNGMDEIITRDVWKQARSYASSDKAFLVQIEACRCLEAMIKHTTYFDNTNDYDGFKSTIWKAIDTATPAVRHAAAAALAAGLVKSFTETASQDSEVPRLKKPKRVNTKHSTGDNEDEMQRPESPGPKKSSILAFGLTDLLKQISAQYVRSSTSNKARAALAVCYEKVLRGLTSRVVSSAYFKVADHLMMDVLGAPHIAFNRYRTLMTRRYVQVILQGIVGRQILGEAGQIDAAKILINDVLKNYPQVLKEKPEPPKHALIAALGALSSLITSLGSAANVFAESCRDALLQVIQHPSYTVQIYAAKCLRIFTFECPHYLLPCLTVCTNSVSRELNALTTGRKSPRRCVGYANALAAALSNSTSHPLHSSVDVNSQLLSLATGLLKSSSKSDLRISSTQIQVAWIIIGGLMSLGPNFVKIHISQFLLLWKNALPRPLTRDNTSHMGYLESSFLTHVRECALGSILSFLQYNSRLLTTDVSRRITAMLQNTSAFLKSLPSKKTTEDISGRLSPALQLQDLDTMVQRRVLQCYTRLVLLSPSSGSEALLQSNLLTLAVSYFADPDSHIPSSLSATIASSAGTFDTVWDVGDNSGFGINGMIRGFAIKHLPGQRSNDEQKSFKHGTSACDEIDAVLLSPICGALEHDSLCLYTNGLQLLYDLPDPPATEVVNSAIVLFAIALPITPPKIQESILEQITTFLSTSSLQRDPGRKAAMSVNITTAMLSTLKVAVKETSSLPGDLTSTSVQQLMQDILHKSITQPDDYLCNIGYEALGRLCQNSGNAFTNQEIRWLIDMIVANREPRVRAGCAMALGCIHSQVGGMAAGFHLKTILGVLMSLCNDPHPNVHYWALESLARVSDSAGLSFSGYASSTLGMLGQLYLTDTHNAEASSQANSNLEVELNTPSVIARCVDSLINVLGPDLQDMAKARELILTLVGQFRQEDSPMVLEEAMKSLEHLSLYAPGHLNFIDHVVFLQSFLQSHDQALQDIAVDGLYNLMKRSPEEVVKVADDGIEDQFWLVLDSRPMHDGVKNLIRNWLQQTCLTETTHWLQRFQKVLTMTKTRDDMISTATTSGVLPDLQDEEVAGFAASATNGAEGGAISIAQDQEPLRWQIRTFAMRCLANLFSMVAKDTAINESAAAKDVLQQKVADVIRMAFSASTSNVVELRICGLKIIDTVLVMFGKTADPDFAEAPLLEQYQAQISSALTPAFAADSSPELASEAINVCAVFIATGIVTDIDRMGRILKTLVTALETFSSHAQNASIGDLKGLSSNAQVMIRMAVLSAWAELQVASREQVYLVEVMKPHLAKLTPLWLASLREFARLRFEPDNSMSLGSPTSSENLDSVYSAQNRQTLLKFYQNSWLRLVDAIASLIEGDSEFVFDALDGKEVVTVESDPQTKGYDKRNEINYRDEPVAFFFVLFGLAFEALAARPVGDALAAEDQTLEILLALKKILHPNVSGHAIYREAIFAETMDLLDRLVLTAGLDIQAVIVEIARGLCISHPSAMRDAPADTDDLSEDIEQLFELTRIVVLVLSGLLPNLSETKQATRPLTEEAVHVVRLALNALVDAADVFPVVIKTDLHACIFNIFATILGTATCQTVVVPLALPILKRFTTQITSAKSSKTTQVHSCLKRFLTIYLNAQKRETEASLPCVKNSLLAIMVLLTSGTNSISVSSSFVRQFLDELVDCLDDRMTAKVASNCLRSLLVQTSKSNADESIVRYLMPRLVAYVADTEADDPEKARSLISHALTVFVSTLPKLRIAPAMALLISVLLTRARNESDDSGKAVLQETSARLSELAAADQEAFRNVVKTMEDGQRRFLEEVIRSGRVNVGRQRKTDLDEDGEPTIALRMDFGTG